MLAALLACLLLTDLTREGRVTVQEHRHALRAVRVAEIMLLRARLALDDCSVGGGRGSSRRWKGERVLEVGREEVCEGCVMLLAGLLPGLTASRCEGLATKERCTLPPEMVGRV